MKTLLIHVRHVLLALSFLAPLSWGDDTGAPVKGLKIAPGDGGFPNVTQTNDGLGSDVTAIGDVDGDGVMDLAVGASYEDDGGLARGAVFILFLESTGVVRDTTRISDTAGGFGGELEDLIGFGHCVEAIGDLDGDSIPDLAVGQRVCLGCEEIVWILFLNEDGTVREEVRIANDDPLLSGLVMDAVGFGLGLAWLGDLDADGTTELAVGAPGADFSGSSTGAYYLLSLDPLGAVTRVIEVSGGLSGFGGALADRDNFGLSLARVPDLNGDGTDDLVVGASGVDDGASNAGGAWILFLQPDGTVSGEQLISATVGGLVGPLHDNTGFGTEVSAIPDLDGDGLPELLVGAPFVGPPEGGTVWILGLAPDGTVTRENRITTNGPEFPGVTAGDAGLGDGLAFLGDLDGDGLQELACGALMEDSSAALQTGAVWLLSLCTAELGVAIHADPEGGISAPLSVAFSSSSAGEPVSGWLWDFGDGGTSLLPCPTHTYVNPGSYSVTLVATGVSGACGVQAIDLIHVGVQKPASKQPALASVVSRNGTGINPEILTTNYAPVLGTTWIVQVDAAAIGVTGGVEVLFAHLDPLDGLLLDYGELLIDTTSPQVFMDSGRTTHAISIPNDSALQGTPFSMQVLVQSNNSFTNALDGVLGIGSR